MYIAGVDTRSPVLMHINQCSQTAAFTLYFSANSMLAICETTSPPMERPATPTPASQSTMLLGCTHQGRSQLQNRSGGATIPSHPNISLCLHSGLPRSRTIGHTTTRRQRATCHSPKFGTRRNPNTRHCHAIATHHEHSLLELCRTHHTSPSDPTRRTHHIEDTRRHPVSHLQKTDQIPNTDVQIMRQPSSTLMGPAHQSWQQDRDM